MVRAGRRLANKSARHFGPKPGDDWHLAESRFDVSGAFGRRRRSLNPFHGIFVRGVWAGFLALAATVHAAFDPPAGYYSAATGFSGATLKAALHNRIKGHTALPYTASSTDVWDALMVLDADPNNGANVLLLYSGESRSKSLREGSSSGNTWNREHVWPKSLGPFDEDDTPGSDLFHLFACDTSVNGNRASEPFDEVAFTADPEAPLSGSNAANTWWNPRDADKGVLARALFYMAVRYEAEDFVNLELGETAGPPRMAKLSTLRAWHRKFPPTEAERKRNHTIYTTYQFNRNPFIDNPLFVDQVFSNDTPGGAWKRARFTAAQLANAAVSGDAVDPDGDGRPNRLEYLLNTNPMVAEAAGEAATTVAWVPPAGGGGTARLALSHRRQRYATDLVVTYEASADCVTWTAFTPAATATVYVDGLTDRVTVETPFTGDRRFLRVRVERP
jgi:endonuclease I